MKQFKKVFSGVLVLAMLIGYALHPLVTQAREVIPKTIMAMSKTYSHLSGVEGFVTRLYNVCLDREPDKVGYNDWIDKLKSGTIDGAEAAHGFIFSKEFREKNPCNGCYLDSLYRCFLGREPDKNGKADWMNRLSEGATRGEIFNGFVGSQEFTKICESYGINRGGGDWSKETFFLLGDCSLCGVKNKIVEDFVARLYNVCLDRKPDAQGLSDWMNQLNSGKTGAEVAYGFIFSSEFQKKNLCNEHYVDYMYRAFFGREADAIGKASWTSVLNEGTKGQVFDGFVGSQEFVKLCAQYGIKSGTMGYGNSDFKSSGSCVACLTPSVTTPDRPAEPTLSKPSETKPVETKPQETDLPQTNSSETEPPVIEPSDAEQWVFSDDGGALSERNKKLESLTYATGAGGYPVVAPDEGINWEQDLTLEHTWVSNDTDATGYKYFTAWEGDLEGELPSSDTMIWVTWYNSTYNGLHGLGLREWLDMYFEPEYYYSLYDSYAVESKKRLGIDLGTGNISDFCEYTIPDEKAINHENPSEYPHVTLSDVTVPPVEGAVLVVLENDWTIFPYTNDFIVSYDIYGGTGQWSSTLVNYGRCFWAVKK